MSVFTLLRFSVSQGVSMSFRQMVLAVEFFFLEEDPFVHSYTSLLHRGPSTVNLSLHGIPAVPSSAVDVP